MGTFVKFLQKYVVVSLEATKKFVVKYNSFTGVKFERVSTDNATGKWFDNISVTVIIPCFNLVFTRDPLCATKIITEAPPNVRIIGKCCVVRHAYYGRASKDLITDRHLSDVEDTWQHISVYQIKQIYRDSWNYVNPGDMDVDSHLHAAAHHKIPAILKVIVRSSNYCHRGSLRELSPWLALVWCTQATSRNHRHAFIDKHSKHSSRYSITSARVRFLPVVGPGPTALSHGLTLRVPYWNDKQFSASRKDVTFLKMILLCKCYHNWITNPKSLYDPPIAKMVINTHTVFIWEREVFSLYIRQDIQFCVRRSANSFFKVDIDVPLPLLCWRVTGNT